MRWLCRLLTLVLLFAAVPGSFLCAQATDDGEDPDEIPRVGLPPGLPFSEASGSFQIETDAESTSVRMEDPITFIVRVRAAGPVQKAPRRLSLGDLTAFREAFHIEDLPDSGAEVVAVARLVGLSVSPHTAALAGLAMASRPLAWEFRYRLKPKTLAVQEIPSLPFVFYNRKILSPDRRFQVVYADAIPITVKPRESVQTAVQGPPGAFQFSTGPGLLARSSTHPMEPGLGVIVLFLLGPPLACVVWYLVWRRLYPDAARQARQQRSRAARLALDLLRRAPAAPEQRAGVAGMAVTRYLRLRLGLPFAEPTPTETAEYLLRRGCSLDRADEAMRFYQACAAVRFQPVLMRVQDFDAVDLPSRATQLILAVEAET
jgi:hypothetical protein